MDPALRPTIGVNYTRGYHFKSTGEGDANKLMKNSQNDYEMVEEGAEEREVNNNPAGDEDMKKKECYMFFVSKESEWLGPYLDSDFAILRVNIEKAVVIPNEDDAGLAFMHSRPDVFFAKHKQQMTTIKDQADQIEDLKNNHRLLQKEMEDVKKESESIEKLMRDRDKGAR
jgi:hypothetical protein